MHLKGMRSTPLLLLACAVLILTINSANSVVTSSVHSLCHPDVLNSAIQCACFAYLPLISEDTRFENLKEICRQPEDGGKVDFSCEDTRFMESTGIVNVSIIDEFFHNAVERCLYTDSQYQDHVERLRKETNLSSFGHISLDLPTSRIPRSVCTRLLQMCLVMAYGSKVSRINAYRLCHPLQCDRFSNKPHRPAVEESPPLICQEEILRSAAECGCKLFKEEYSKTETWTPLNDNCDETFGTIAWSTSRACTTFMESQHPGVQFKESVLDDYIDEVCEKCESSNTTEDFTCPSKAGQYRLGGKNLAVKFLRRCLIMTYIVKGYTKMKCYDFYSDLL